MPYIEKRIYSGDLLEVIRYFSQKGNTGQRAIKENASSAQQQSTNDREADRWIVRKINTNFSNKTKDLFVTVTYAIPVEEAQAKRDIRNFVRRARRYCRKHGLPELKYGHATEKQGQWHHHLIMSHIPLDVLTELWGKGRVSASILDPTNNFEDLVGYLAKHHKPPKGDPDGENIKEQRKKFARRWIFSKNLKNPKVEIKEIKRLDIIRKPPAASKGYILLPDWKIGCDAWGNLYQFFKCLKINPPLVAARKKRRIKE